MNLYCKICARMSIDLIQKAIKEAKEKLANEKVDESDMKSKARVLKSVFKELALQVNINLE